MPAANAAAETTLAPVLSLATAHQVRELAAKVDELTAVVRSLAAVVEARPLTVAEAARARGASQKTIRRQIAAGEIRHAWTGRRVVV